ncbi:DUF4097 family beta strand repeat-containing protein [Streptomyces sp. NPDC048182]|uniref:DUF4097 family beta strand repeat-containing protein n=1 Tax=Streptomyces sp. NPDC048182 TaxID=3365507 RepID=UPI003717D284
MHTFTTPAPVTVVLDLPAGRVNLIAADRADTVVEVLPADAGKGRDVKAAERIEVACADGVLRVAAPAPARRLLGDSGSVEVTVRVPAGSRVEAKAGAAEFRGVGRLGDVAVEGAYGRVKIDEAAGLRLAVHDGDVLVGRLGGSAEISTGRGDIEVTEAREGAVTLRTGQGSISLGAARGVSAALDAGTRYGRVDNALKNADGADAGLTVHATTGHGDITARSL